MQRIDVVFATHDVGVCDEDDTVDSIQDQLPAGVVFDLTGYRIKRKSGFETLNATEIQWEEIEEKCLSVSVARDINSPRVVGASWL